MASVIAAVKRCAEIDFQFAISPPAQSFHARNAGQKGGLASTYSLQNPLSILTGCLLNFETETEDDLPESDGTTISCRLPIGAFLSPRRPPGKRLDGPLPARHNVQARPIRWSRSREIP